MKLFTVALLAAFWTVVLTQEPTTKPTTVTEPAPTDKPTPVPTTSTTAAAPTSSSTTTTTTPAPTTAKPTPSSTTMEPSSTTTTTPPPPPKPQDPTPGNYTLMNGDEVCAVVLTKIILTQNSTRVPFVNATLDKAGSKCAEDQITLWINSKDGSSLQVVIEQSKTNFYIHELSATLYTGAVAERGNLSQFSTPLKQFYKCTVASEVDLEEENIKVIFSEMRYQAFQKAKTADFVGSQLECVSDTHSDVIIIAIGCALALLVVIILVAYLITRRRNRQRGYQSV